MRPPQESSANHRKSSSPMMFSVVLMGTIKMGSSFHQLTRALLGLMQDPLITARPPARAEFPLDGAE